MDTPGIWPKPTPAPECLAWTFAPALPTSDPADPQTGCPGPPPASATAACPSCPCAHDPGALQGGSLPPDHSHQPGSLACRAVLRHAPKRRDQFSHPDCRPVLILIVAPHIAMSFARILPDVLSRLCCKSSSASKHRVLCFLHRAYSLGNATPYRGIDKLTDRLLNSFSVRERLAIIPRLAEIPIPPKLALPLEHEMRNPLLYLRVPHDSVRGPDTPHIPDATIKRLLQAAAEAISDTRDWALRSLQILHSIGLLDSRHFDAFAEALWTHIDDTGFPSQPRQSRFLFLELPHPPEVDVILLFKEYVRLTPFPVQDNRSGVSLHSTWEIGLIADIVGAADSIEWTDEEVSGHP